MQPKKILILLLAAMCIAMPFVTAEEVKASSTITVQGSGQLDVAPDVAYIQLAVITEATGVREAQKENAIAADRTYARLAEANIQKEDIKTTQYNVIPLYQQDNGKNNDVPAIRGYQIINGFQITAAPDRVGEIIDLALQAGVNQVQTVRFGKKDEASAKNAALQMAVRDAFSQAEAIAAALGKHIVRVQTVTESGVFQQPPGATRYALDNTSTPISAGFLHLNANVQLVLEME